MSKLNTGSEIKNGFESYTIDSFVRSGDFCDFYNVHSYSSAKYVLKITQSADNNDLLQNEARVLDFLQNHKDTKDLPTNKHIIKFHDSFEHDGLQVNILEAFKHRYVSLEDVIKAYPKGIDIRDAVWMFNRMIGALTIPHQAGIVHGALVPSNFLICPEPRSCPEAHNGILIDWSYAANINKKEEKPKPVTVGKKDEAKSKLHAWFAGTKSTPKITGDFTDKIPAVVEKYEHFYPSEVWDKLPANYGIDIFMAAKCFVELMGENEIPRRFKNILDACFLPANIEKNKDEPAVRISDIFDLWDLFQKASESEFGKRAFSEFKIS